MSAQSDRERPPKAGSANAGRWKKGQCGNPGRIYKRTPRSAQETLDACLVKPVDLVINGETRRVTAYEAIQCQLFKKEMDGSRKAFRLRLRYETSAPRDPKDVKVTVIGGLPKTTDGWEKEP